MSKQCFIIEDLLPLYNEALLSEETTKWVTAHLQTCKHCQQLAQRSQRPLEAKQISSADVDKDLFKKINRKLSVYQLVFVSLSLILAMTTSLLNESFHFILTYTILGTVTYLFYKDLKIVFAVAFIPIFLWYVGITMRDYLNDAMIDGFSVGKMILSTLSGGTITAFIHLIFSFIGSFIGFFILKLKESGDNNEKETSHL